MRVWIVLAGILISISVASGQPNVLLENYWQTDETRSDQNLMASKIDAIVLKLDAHSKKSDRQILKTVFNITHRQLLKEYNQYAGFGEIIQSGQYDCLTATALYSLLLTRLGYQHKIIETNYHIFLLVQSTEGEILMESTDPLNGFEYHKDKIEDRIKTYKLDHKVIGNSKINYPFTYQLFNEVTPQQLTGLLYYNQCVKAFNDQQWIKAIQLLNKAKAFYNSPRTVEMEDLLLTVIASVELEKAKTHSMETSKNVHQIAKRNE